MLLENKNTAFSLQFDSYCSATKKSISFVKAILLLTNEPTLVCENLLCYLAKKHSFCLSSYHSSLRIQLSISHQKAPKTLQFHPEYNLCTTSKNARDVKLVVDWHTAC